MFWKYSHQTHPQQLDYLLDKKDVTLQELLDEEDVLQECRAQNKKLIEFLIRPEIMEELVTLTTVEPTVGSGDGDGNCDSLDEFTLYKYPNTACELLACDIPTLNERLAGDEALMRRLYSFLEAEPPLNPLLASFFARTLGVLLTRNSEQNWYSYQLTCLQVLEFLKSREDFVSLLLRHMGTSAIMDLMFKLFTSVEGDEMKLNLLNWLNGQQVVQRLVSLFHPSIDSERHSNTAYLLCMVISKCRDNAAQAETRPPSTNIILKIIESPQIVASILDLILSDGPNGDKSESAIVGGISVLLDILDYNPNSRENGLGSCGLGHVNRDNENTASGEEHKLMVEELVQTIVLFLPKLHALLLDPPHKASVRTTAEVLNVPLGATRLHVAKLICALIATHSPAIDSCLIKLKTINVLLDLFFKYTWNNFLHTQVEHAISLALDIPKSKTNQENERGEVQEWKDSGKLSELEVSEEINSETKTDVVPVEEVEMQQDKTSDIKDQGNGEADKTKEEDAQEPSLVHHLFTNCNIIQRILDAWEENKEEQTKPSGRRRGYMGHLIKIANNVAKVTVPPSEEETQDSVVAPLATTGISCDKEGTRSPLTSSSPTSSPSPPNSPSPPTSPAEKNKPQFYSLIKPPVLDEATHEKWCTFVSSLLAQANATNNVLLGGEHPSHASPASDEAVYGGVQIRQESVLQENYNAFQIQQIAPMFTENYHDEGFTDEDDTQHDAVDHVPSMAYNMSEDDLTRQTELFKQMCAEKMHASSSCSSLDGSDPEEADEEDEDEDDDEARSFDRGSRGFMQRRVDFSPCARGKHSGGERHDGNSKGRGSSSDEDEDDDGGRRQRRKEIQMEVDSTDPWATLDPSSNLGLAPVAMDEAPNPWGDSTGIIGASQLASIAPSSLLASQDDSAVGWADFGSATGLGAVGGFANFEANFGMSPEESSEQKDPNKNMETIQSNEDVGETSVKGGCSEGTIVIPMLSQRVPKPIGEGMPTETPEMSQPAQVGRSEDVAIGGDEVPAASIVGSKCNSTMPDDRRLMIGSDDNANPSIGGSSKDLEDQDERETRQLIDNYKFLFFSVVSSSGIGNIPGSPAPTVDPSEPCLDPDSTILPASSPVPSLPAHPASDDPQQTEAGRKLGSLAAEAPVLPQPSAESPANGPV